MSAATVPAQKRVSGFIAVAGRPNAGKSTLLNRIAGNKVSIVSHRRQTTRSVIRLVSEDTKEHSGVQTHRRIAWLDTPGWQTQHGGGFNRALNVAAEWASQIADAIVFVAVADSWTRADSGLLDKLPDDRPLICALNKIDTIAGRDHLLPIIDSISRRRNFAAIVPISAKRGDGIAALIDECATHLSERDDLISQEDDPAFFFAELLREKLFRALGDELPYCIGVVTTVSEASKKLLNVNAEIYVERESQKAIVIGRHGKMLKRVAIAARRDMEKYSGKKVYLQNQVKVADWRHDTTLLRKMRIGNL